MNEEELKQGYQPKSCNLKNIVPPSVSTNVKPKKDGYTWEDLDKAWWEGFDNAKNKMEKQIAELKGEADSVLDNWCRGNAPCPHLKKRDEQLIKAKEIIKNLLFLHNDKFGSTRLEWRYNVVAEAEQFIKE